MELLFSFNSLVFEEVICTHVFILMQKLYIMIHACQGTCKIEMLFLRGILSVYGLCDGVLCE